MTEAAIKKFNGIGNSLKAAREPYEAHFRELGKNFQPRRSRWSENKGHKSEANVNKYILNGRPRYDHRTMQSGMHSGITSPARPWFRLLAKNKELRQRPEVKEHFHQAEIEIRQLLQSSGMYTMLHTLWGDLGLYGYDAAIMEDDIVHGLYGQAMVPGEAWIGVNGRGMVDTMYRQTRYTVNQIVTKFVFENDPRNKPDWSVVSQTVKNLWDKDNVGELVRVRHLIAPRADRDLRSSLAQDKPIMSAYWEEGHNDKLMADLGYDESPILASRWDVAGTDVYGGSPCMDALGDAKELQRKERDKAEAMRRINRPPMNLPTEMRNSPFSLMPEAENYMSDPTKGAVPAYQINPRINELVEDIRTSEERVSEGTYANLFLMIANLDRRQITAREIDERHEEKLLALGPVLERQHREKLSIVVRRGYNKVVDEGKVPPLPEEFDGIPVEIDYISTLAQAQKAVATGGMERLYAFLGNLHAVDGSVMDKVDNDKAVDEYADMVGISSSVVRSQEETDEIRRERQEQVAQQQAVQQAGEVAQVAQTGAQAAKVLSEADAPRAPGGGGAGSILRDLGLR
jgi:hypothetical protein